MNSNTSVLPRAAGKAASYGPQFSASKFESELIIKIAQRAVELARELGVRYDMTTALMDIEACHCNGCPLELDRLLKADAGTFGHDVFGIRRHIDRTTGTLKDCFLPRTALPVSKGGES